MSKRTPRLTSFPCPDCDFTTPEREEVQLHRRAVHAKATAPRYTAHRLIEVARCFHGTPWDDEAAAMLRQAAETERALPEFRQQIVDFQLGTVNHSGTKLEAREVAAIQGTLGVLLAIFDRRFGRTP